MPVRQRRPRRPLRRPLRVTELLRHPTTSCPHKQLSEQKRKPEGSHGGALPDPISTPPLHNRIDNTPQANTKPQHSILSVPTKPIHLQHTPRPTTVRKTTKTGSQENTRDISKTKPAQATLDHSFSEAHTTRNIERGADIQTPNSSYNHRPSNDTKIS